MTTPSAYHRCLAVHYRQHWWQFWRPVEITAFQRCLAVHIAVATKKGALQ